MRAILVCVDYADLLAVTLPYNRHHFDDVMVVTASSDTKSSEVALANDAKVYTTDSFYLDGAKFNKWRALEEALDAYGREGWMCIMDADVLWPKHLPDSFRDSLQPGFLYAPLRRMFTDLSQPIPQEPYWRQYPIHRNIGEWAGYSQLFHCSDPALGEPPWHQIDWLHAGGADSFFQAKWHPSRKIRPAFEVLHLGEAGQNWCGRATPYLDGSQHPESQDRINQTRTFIAGRRTGVRRFDGERIKR